MYKVPQEDCIDGIVRLVNGSVDVIEGRVEVCANQTWSTVLGSNWEDDEAMMVCRQLGHSDQGTQCLYRILSVIKIIQVTEQVESAFLLEVVVDWGVTVTLWL